jgi:uncharacterized membrane protein YeaQ/YmgE (transglycosylase-associated protein family)
MMILLILLTGIAAGMLPGLFGPDRLFSVTNILVGVAGALSGALLGFGDVPLLLEYPFLNEKSLMIATSLLFVLTKTALTRSPKQRDR